MRVQKMFQQIIILTQYLFNPTSLSEKRKYLIIGKKTKTNINYIKLNNHPMGNYSYPSNEWQPHLPPTRKHFISLNDESNIRKYNTKVNHQQWSFHHKATFKLTKETVKKKSLFFV